MWTLRHPSGQLIHLLPDTTTTIGRKSCDLILEDPSVSHLHAKILIKPNNSNDYINNKYSSKCIINNAGSKKRTKIISEKTIYLLPFTNYELQPNDKIHFSSKNEWIVSYTKISLLTCGDCIDQIKNLNKIITSIGGTVFTEWNEDCNFYTTICKRVTPKFVTALAAGLPFVTLKYWEDFYTCCKTRKEFPNPSQYILEDWNYTDELKDISLHPEAARKNLFDNMEFIFFSNYQIGLYGEIIQLAGGRPLMCAKYGFKDKYLLAENTIIIACDDNQRTSNSCCGLSESDYQNVCRLLVKEKRKMIDETEIVKAIMLCSREKYCNTGFSKLNDLKKPKQVIKYQQAVVIEHKKIIKSNIPDENQQYTKKLPKKHADTSSTIHVNENNINQEQFVTSTPVVPRFPEAIIKLQKLTPNFISQFKYHKTKSDINEKPTKRKRTSDSPSISGSKDPFPDVFPSEDNCLIKSDSKRKPDSKRHLKIVNDQLIPEKIIIKSSNKTKKRKTESDVSSTSHLKDNKITKKLIDSSKSDVQSKREKVDSRSHRQSPVTSIRDKRDNTTVNNKEKVSRISEEIPSVIKEEIPEDPRSIENNSQLWESYSLDNEEVPRISEEIPEDPRSIENNNQRWESHESRNEDEAPRISEEVPPVIKEKTPEKSIPIKNKSQVWELYDSHKEKANIKKLPISKQTKNIPPIKFTSFFDCYRPKSTIYPRNKKEINIKYPLEDNKIKQKRIMIKSFLNTENQNQCSQSTKNSRKLPFFMNSENDDNDVPNFILKQR